MGVAWKLLRAVAEVVLVAPVPIEKRHWLKIWEALGLQEENGDEVERPGVLNGGKRVKGPIDVLEETWRMWRESSWRLLLSDGAPLLPPLLLLLLLPPLLVLVLLESLPRGRVKARRTRPQGVATRKKSKPRVFLWVAMRVG